MMTTLEKSLIVSYTLKHTLNRWQAIQILSIYPKEWKIYLCKKDYIRMLEQFNSLESQTGNNPNSHQNKNG